MKKLISLFLSILFISLMFTGCNLNSIEQTNNELTLWILYSDGFSLEYEELSTAISEFKKAYPQIKININRHDVSLDIDEMLNYYKKLATECMAGKGPDIIYYTSSFSVANDIYKLQKSGAFVDLTKFMEKDDSFIIDDYNQVILDKAKYNDKQYIMPLNYTIPIFTSTKEAITKSKINIDNFSDSNALIEELTEYWQKNQTNKNAPQIFPDPRSYKFFYNYMGLPIIDHENSKANLNNDTFKKGIEFWKLAYPLETGHSGYTYQSRFVPDYFNNEKYAIALQSNCKYKEYFLNMRALRMIGEPIIMPWRDINGNIQAELTSGIMINSTSTNKKSAWNFIKLALGKQSQERFCELKIGIPVLKSSWDTKFDLYTKDLILNDGPLANTKGLPMSDLEDFKKLQTQIAGVYMRFPSDRDFYDKFVPYFEGKQSYDQVIKEAQSFIDIYLSE